MNRVLNAIALASTIALTSAADAQMRIAVAETAGPGPEAMMGRRSGPDLQSSPVTPQEFEDYIRILQFDDAMEAVARDMYEGFRTEVAEANAAFRERMTALVQEVQETQNHQKLMEAMPKLQDDRTATSERLRDTFLEDLKLLLSDEQLERWPLLEQSRRRMRVQSRLHIGGSAVDLIALTERTIQNPPDGVGEKLATYARDLDRLLLDIIDLREEREGQREMFGAPDQEQQEKMRELSDKQRELSVEIRALNDRTLRLLAADLASQDVETLDEAFRLAAFPEIYAPSYTDNALASALNMSSLSDEQTDRLRALAASHTTSAGNLNTRWERELREQQENPGNTMFFSGPGGASFEITLEEEFDGEERDETPLEKARNARTEHDEKILARLRGLLNETQLAQLPPEPKEFDPFDPANLPEGANAVFISTVESNGGETVTDVQVLTPEGNVTKRDEKNDSKKQ